MQFDGEPFWQWEDTGDAMRVTAHAGKALHDRAWARPAEDGVPALPVMAPYFDMAFGWGVGAALWLVPGLRATGCVLLGPMAALLWDLPVRWLEAECGVPKAASVMVLMTAAVVVPLLLLPGVARRQPSAEPDWLLFAIQLANQAFFVYNAVLTDPAIIPPSWVPHHTPEPARA